MHVVQTFKPSKFSSFRVNPAASSATGVLTDDDFAIDVPVSKPVTEEDSKLDLPGLAGFGLGAVALIGGLVIVGPFVIAPWIIKQFEPDWSYGKRVATGFVASFAVGALTQIARAASGSEEK